MRKATKADIPSLLEMGRAFTSAGNLGFDEAAATAALESLIDGESGVVLMSNTGMIGGMVYPGFFNGRVIAQEFFWWSERNGLELLGAFESWAASKGASQVVMVCLEALSPERVSKIYMRRGYQPLEHSFVKDL